MQKIVKLLISILICTLIFSGCSVSSLNNSDRIQIICSTYPLYDWVRNITSGAENTEITLLAKNGVDIHSFQPSAEDIIKISNADLVVYSGGESDIWIQDALKNANKFGFNCLENLNDPLTLDGHNNEYDEHFWLSPRCAAEICEKLTYNLIGLDTKNQDIYRSNTDEYLNSLDTLDKEYLTLVSTAKRRELILPDRNPFRYIERDYSVIFNAAFDGCSADTEASFDTIIALSKKADELNANSIIAIKDSNLKVIDSVIMNLANKDIDILVMNSMQSVTESEFDYIKTMQENLEVLKTALN